MSIDNDRAELRRKLDTLSEERTKTLQKYAMDKFGEPNDETGRNPSWYSGRTWAKTKGSGRAGQKWELIGLSF